MNKEIMRAAGFGAEVDAVEAGNCPTCGKSICPEDFRGEIDRQEFRISGMCQSCQDVVFSED